MVEFLFSNSDYISVKVILQIKEIDYNRGSRIKDQGDRFQTRMLLQWTQHPAGLSTRLADLLEKVKSNLLSIEVKSISQIKHDLDLVSEFLFVSMVTDQFYTNHISKEREGDALT